MKIALILKVFPTLSETFILNQITGLIDRGHSVTIFAHHGDPRNTHPEVSKYGLLELTVYSPTLAGKTRAARMLESTRWLAGCGRLALPCLTSAATAWRLATRAAAFNLVRAAMRHSSQADSSYDVIHCHFGQAGLTGALLQRAGILRGSLVTSFYGCDVSRLPHEWGQAYLSPIFRQSDLLIGLSARMRQKLIAFGADPARTIVHHLGVNPERFSFRGRTLSIGKPIRLVSVARLVEKKGLEYSLRAVSEIHKRGIALDYRIVGDGPLRSDLEEITRQLGITERVRFMGSCSQDTVAAELDRAHIFLLPSVCAENGDEEGTPTVLLEAMAAGLPVLSTRHSGIPEQVPDGLAGFLVPERDVSALAERLMQLAQHPEIWPDLGSAGRQQVEKHFDIRKLNAELENHYKRITD